ncbi:MAG: molybdopterin-dependent oxidoreductase [Myxococcota bacterium]
MAEGRSSGLSSVCTLDCPDRCSLSVRVEDGRVAGLDGSEANPLTAGFICGKVRKFGQHRVHGPLRLHHPMIRTGPKGPGATFRRASWDEAIAAVAERFRAIAEQDGWEAVWPYWYGGSNGWLTGGGLDVRLWRRLGTSGIARTLCAENAAAGARAVYGDLPSADPLDVDDADLIVIWGFNPSASGIHWVPRVQAARARGAALVVVDPPGHAAREEADLHLAPLPGTDVALALAVAGVALERGLADEAFLARWCDGVDAYRAAAAAWPAARAAEVCGLAAADIERLAALWAERRERALLRTGWGLERTRNGSDAVRAALSLPAVFGAFGRRGAGYVTSTSPGRRVDSEGWQRVPGEPARPPRVLNMSRLGRVLEETRDPPIRALYVYDCNPVATAPDQARVVRALARDDLFVVVHEQVHTDTVDYADVVLPATTFLEHLDVSYGYGANVLGWSEPVIPPVGEARSNHATIAALAAALGLGDEPALAEPERALAERIAAAAGPGPELVARGVVPGARPVQLVDALPASPSTSPPAEHRPCSGRPRRRRPAARPPLPVVDPRHLLDPLRDAAPRHRHRRAAPRRRRRARPVRRRARPGPQRPGRGRPAGAARSIRAARRRRHPEGAVAERHRQRVHRERAHPRPRRRRGRGRLLQRRARGDRGRRPRQNVNFIGYWKLTPVGMAWAANEA